MKLKSRQEWLILGAIALIALWTLDKIVFTPLANLWKNRSKAVVELRGKVDNGGQLIRREQQLRRSWDEMRTNTLPNNSSRSEQRVLAAFNRWAQESRATITSINPQWKHDSDDYMTLQCRVEAEGTMNAVSRFLYDIERDPMALRLEIVEVSSRDAEGQRLALGLQVSGLVLTPREKRP